MPEVITEVSPLSPLHFGDGRPFGKSDGAETYARSKQLPSPSTLAGFIRTQVAKAAGLNMADKDTLQMLHALPVYGPLLTLVENSAATYYLPPPKDALVYKDGSRLQIGALKPHKGSRGRSNMPNDLAPLAVPKLVKPEPGRPYWSNHELTRWLAKHEVRLSKEKNWPKEDSRVQIAVNGKTGTAQSGMLYTVSYSDYGGSDHYWTIRARSNLENGLRLSAGYLGGERRPVGVTLYEDLAENWYDPPNEVKEAFASFDPKRNLIRMVLATPALFEHGWKPAWLSKETGSLQLPRGLANVKLRLVAAAVGRREAVSGWNLRTNQPKPVRWAVPAGSVYFFEVAEGDPAAVLKSWMRPVSDREQDRKDGFGLAVWGIGGYADEN